MPPKRAEYYERLLADDLAAAVAASTAAAEYMAVHGTQTVVNADEFREMVEWWVKNNEIKREEAKRLRTELADAPRTPQREMHQHQNSERSESRLAQEPEVRELPTRPHTRHQKYFLPFY